MNTKEKVIAEINRFLASDNKYLLLTGTFQNEKHPLVLDMLAMTPGPLSILFRSSTMQNASLFLENKKPRSRGTPIILGTHKIYLDSINKTSWRISPKQVDVGILYPIDAFSPSEGHACVEDFLTRGAQKIFLVSWTDNVDLTWTDSLSCVHAIYDAEAERPDYHKRMLESIQARPRTIRNLPQYAQDTDPNFLKKIFCKGKCGEYRWMRLNKQNPGDEALRKANDFEYKATCLKCGYVATDNYNW